MEETVAVLNKASFFHDYYQTCAAPVVLDFSSLWNTVVQEKLPPGVLHDLPSSNLPNPPALWESVDVFLAEKRKQRILPPPFLCDNNHICIPRHSHRADDLCTGNSFWQDSIWWENMTDSGFKVVSRFIYIQVLVQVNSNCKSWYTWFSLPTDYSHVYKLLLTTKSKQNDD